MILWKKCYSNCITVFIIFQFVVLLRRWIPASRYWRSMWKRYLWDSRWLRFWSFVARRNRWPTTARWRCREDLPSPAKPKIQQVPDIYCCYCHASGHWNWDWTFYWYVYFYSICALFVCVFFFYNLSLSSCFQIIKNACFVDILL